MTTSTADKRDRFRALHAQGCFVMPNPWDVGSAIALEGLGFSALATTSAGMAWAMGRADTKTPLESVLKHLEALAAAIDLPLNADFEGGYAVDPQGVAANVTRAVATGVAGLSIEDSSGDAEAPLFDFNLAVERIAAARAAIDAAGGGGVLTGRSEGFIAGRPDLEETVRRLQAYAEAGADCLYAPGITTPEEIAEVVKAVAPKPVNVLAGKLSAQVLASLGVRRISVGGSLARVAWGAFLAAAREIDETGSFDAFASAAKGSELNRMFAGRG